MEVTYIGRQFDAESGRRDGRRVIVLVVLAVLVVVSAQEIHG